MKLFFTTLDVFTSTRYLGNPLAIITVPADQKDALTQIQKQAIAKEFNLSETVFLHEPTVSSSEVAIDIFTSIAEIPFAGHPTIGTAFYLLCVQKQPITALITKAGRIPVSLDVSTSFIKAECPHDIHIHSLALESPLNGRQNPVVSIVNGMAFCYVPLPDLETLAKATTNLYGHSTTKYSADLLDEGWRNGLVGTMYYVLLGKDQFGRESYRTRMIAWREDPATGSASSGLGAYLALQEGKEKGDGPFGYFLTQGVEMGKESQIVVEVVKEDGKVKSVLLSGTAVKMMEGSLEV